MCIDNCRLYGCTIAICSLQPILLVKQVSSLHCLQCKHMFRGHLYENNLYRIGCTSPAYVAGTFILAYRHSDNCGQVLFFGAAHSVTEKVFLWTSLGRTRILLAESARVMHVTHHLLQYRSPQHRSTKPDRSPANRWPQGLGILVMKPVPSMPLGMRHALCNGNSFAWIL